MPAADCANAHSTRFWVLFEVLFVLIIVGILSAIAAPSWIAFTNRQRVNVANDAVLRATRRSESQGQTQLQRQLHCLFKTNPKLLSIQRDLCRARQTFGGLI